MRKIINTYRHSEYIKNFTALAGSEIIAQIIVIGITPLLTRVYTPSDFGRYEFFKTSGLMLVVIGFLNYDASIYTSKNTKDRINSIILSALILFGICLVSAILLFFFNDNFVNLFASEIKNGWYWTLPTYAFFAALTNLMLVIMTKNGSFKLLSSIKIVVSILVASTQLFFGWLNLGYWGLVYSTIVVQFIAFVLYFRTFYVELKSNLNECSLESIKYIMANNWRLPLIVFPGNFLNNIVQSLPVFFLGRMDTHVLGYFGLARRIIDFPLKFITSAVQRLYVKELTDEIEKTGIGSRTYLKNLKLYGAIAVVLLLGIFTLTKPLIPALFGGKWEPAVPYIMILGILFSVRFVFGGLSFVMILGKAPKIDILWQISFGILMTLTFFICSRLDISPIYTIWAYVITGTISYFSYGVMGYIVAKSKRLLSL